MDVASLELISSARCFGGEQRVYRHLSVVLGCPMKFGVFLPPAVLSAGEDARFAALTWLSGLTCTEENFMFKSAGQKSAAKHSLIVINPDTSPRGCAIAGEDDDWAFGSGAGFYVDATKDPWRRNYRMFSYVSEELPRLCQEQLGVDAKRQGIGGHSMGGHGALMLSLRCPEVYRSVSAMSPIVAPTQVSWGETALSGYLGSGRPSWLAYDTCALLAAGHRFPSPPLVDQGLADDFLDTQLRPHLLRQACIDADQPLDLRLHVGYDHSFYFVSTFIADHMQHHARVLG